MVSDGRQLVDKVATKHLYFAKFYLKTYFSTINIVIVPGGCRPEIKEYLAFRCDLQFQSPVRAKPVRRLIKLEIDLKDRYSLIGGLQPPGTSIILVYNQATT